MVEAVMLEVAAELHPQCLTREGLMQRIVTKPNDQREVETASWAINTMREFGVLGRREDGIVELTVPALHVTALLTGFGGPE
jgi:hypothetical protein